MSGEMSLLMLVKKRYPNCLVFFNCKLTFIYNKTGESTEEEFSCGVYSTTDHYTPISKRPGRMEWRMDGRILGSSDEYETVIIFSNFLQHLICIGIAF